MEEYEKRCRETLARRLLIELEKSGVLTQYAADELRYPSEEDLAEAEGLNDG